MRHGYLATEPSRDAFSYAGSLNVSGVTVNECARDRGLKSRLRNNTGSMLFVSAVYDFGRRLNQRLFRPRAEVSFPRARQFSEYELRIWMVYDEYELRIQFSELRDSVRKAREAFLISKGRTLLPHGLNIREEPY